MKEEEYKKMKELVAKYERDKAKEEYDSEILLYPMRSAVALIKSDKKLENEEELIATVSQDLDAIHLIARYSSIKGYNENLQRFRGNKTLAKAASKLIDETEIKGRYYAPYELQHALPVQRDAYYADEIVRFLPALLDNKKIIRKIVESNDIPARLVVDFKEARNIRALVVSAKEEKEKWSELRRDVYKKEVQIIDSAYENLPPVDAIKQLKTLSSEQLEKLVKDINSGDIVL